MRIRKIQNNQKIFLQHLFKSYVEGIYSDSHLNRKLGRAGLSYSKIKTIDNPDSGGGNINKEISNLEKMTISQKENYIYENYEIKKKNGIVYILTKYPNYYIKIINNRWLWTRSEKNGKETILKALDINEAFKRLQNQGKKINKENKDLEKIIEELNTEIQDIKYKIALEEGEKEGWEEQLKVVEEGTENYQYTKEKIEEHEVAIANFKIDIEEKEKKIKEYQDKLVKLKEEKPQKEKEYLTLNELQHKYPKEHFGPNDYPRILTAAEQNHDRNLE